jgi:hypothetical protein
MAALEDRAGAHREILFAHLSRIPKDSTLFILSGRSAHDRDCREHFFDSYKFRFLRKRYFAPFHLREKAPRPVGLSNEAFRVWT